MRKLNVPHRKMLLIWCNYWIVYLSSGGINLHQFVLWFFWILMAFENLAFSQFWAPLIEKKKTCVTFHEIIVSHFTVLFLDYSLSKYTNPLSYRYIFHIFPRSDQPSFIDAVVIMMLIFLISSYLLANAPLCVFFFLAFICSTVFFRIRICFNETKKCTHSSR